MKVSSPPPVVEGNTLTYNVTVTNNGPSDAQNVVLSDVLSPDVTLVSANFGAATVQETPLPPGIPQSIASSAAFEAIEDNLSQPVSLGQVLTIELNLPSLLLETAGTLLQQGQNPSGALPDLMAATVVERIDDIFHQQLSASHVMSLENGLFDLFSQTYQSMLQQGLSSGQALLSAFYLDQVECDLFAIVLMDNGVDVDTAVSQMLPSLLLQTVDMIDPAIDL